MKYFEFSDEEKIALFDLIASNFYNQNFGKISKSDIELMMFHFYYDKMTSVAINEDGLINYSKCSDYKISKELGITQQRVKNLKVKSQLIYPVNMDWKQSFATLVKNARYDQNTKKVIINIPDPNLFIEIENYLEENGAYIEKQLNSKILQIRAEYFIDLLIVDEPVDQRRKIIKEIRSTINKGSDEEKEFDERNIGKTIIENGADIATIITNIMSILSPGNILLKSLCSLIS